MSSKEYPIIIDEAPKLLKTIDEFENQKLKFSFIITREQLSRKYNWCSKSQQSGVLREVIRSDFNRDKFWKNLKDLGVTEKEKPNIEIILKDNNVKFRGNNEKTNN